MTAEVLTLGQLSKWISNLKLRADRKAIAKVYGSRLWNRSFTVTMAVPTSTASLKLAMNPTANRRIYNTLALMHYLMGIVSPGSDWRRRLKLLVTTTPLAIEGAMGFPSDWQKRVAWQ